MSAWHVCTQNMVTSMSPVCRRVCRRVVISNRVPVRRFCSVQCMMLVVIVLVLLLVGCFVSIAVSIHEPRSKSWIPSLSQAMFTTNRNHTIPDIHSPRKVIVVSYMRSGSTLTADIIQQYPSMFYVFEPLYTVEKLVRNSIVPVYFNKPARMNIATEYTPKMHVLTAFLNCSLRDADIATLHQHHMDKSRSTWKYNKCIRNTTLREFESHCLKPLIDSCTNSDVSMVKTIRSKMEAMEELLVLNPDLKVIHLIRDPRATLHSRLKLPGSFVTKMTKLIISQASSHCQVVLRDIHDTIRLSKLYPSRVALLLYEKLISDPLMMTRLIYEFLDLPMNPDILRYVYNITSAGHPDTCVVCTQRKNATETANRWRTGLSYEHVMSIDDDCLRVYSHLGYLPFKNSKDLRNLQVPSWIETPFYPTLTDKYSYKDASDII